MRKIAPITYCISLPSSAHCQPNLEGIPPGHDQDEEPGCWRTGWAKAAGQLHPVNLLNVLEENVEFLWAEKKPIVISKKSNKYCKSFSNKPTFIPPTWNGFWNCCCC
jgi:hypothetical protein